MFTWIVKRYRAYRLMYQAWRLVRMMRRIQMDRTIVYRGSLTDLATDIAYEITAVQAQELVDELNRFIHCEPDKFQNAARRMDRPNDQS